MSGSVRVASTDKAADIAVKRGTDSRLGWWKGVFVVSKSVYGIIVGRE